MNIFIFTGLLIIMGGIILRLTNEAPLLDIICIFLGTVMFFCGIFIVDTPTAMDVYRGKTTLEITYRNNIPVDSVVVFKGKEK